MSYNDDLSLANPMDPVVREDSASRAAGHVPSAELVDDKIGAPRQQGSSLPLVASCCRLWTWPLLPLTAAVFVVQEVNRRV
jgi:hypothetical protein